MSGWAIVVVIGIVVWGIVQMARARAGIISDEDGNQTWVARDDAARNEEAYRTEAGATRREIEQLRERLHVLERIATDNNSGDAQERARIAAEIEALRAPDEASLTEQTAADNQSADNQSSDNKSLANKE